LHCCTVNGLDNIDVGVSNTFPTEGSPVSTNSYTLCGQFSGSVTSGMEITIRCPPLQQAFRYVIVRSSSTTAEYMCLAEVAVYVESQYIIMVILTK